MVRIVISLRRGLVSACGQAGHVEARGCSCNPPGPSPDVVRVGGDWRVRGHTPGVATVRSLAGSGSTIAFRQVGPQSLTFRVTVRVDGRVIRRGALSEFYSYTPPSRVFQGTDAFMNYCIDQSKTVYSYHLRLFCWRRSSTVQYLTLTRR